MDEKTIAKFPSAFPQWAREMGAIYSAGNTSTFVLHGNVHDLIRVEDRDGVSYVALAEFLSSQLFGSWDVALHYDMTRPPRALAGTDKSRLKEMNAHLERYFGDRTKMPRDPTKVLALLNHYVERILLADADKRYKVAVLFDYAHLLLPRVPAAQTPEKMAANLITVLNWARSPYIKRVNFAFCMVAEELSALNEALVQNAHTRLIDLPYPDRDERLAYIEWFRGGRDFKRICEVEPKGLAKLTAGLTLVNIQGLLQAALRHEKPISLEELKVQKKALIESSCQGLVELIEPSHDLEMVVGHEQAKQRLRDDAELIRRNHLDAVPMGYLLCGPVGTGKSFLATCYAGEIGIPCIKMLNFRSKYVGETEGNLEKILKVLRVMGPVVVMIDEADAALGDRDSSGDAGTSSRVFGLIATQMGNTDYRGQILWLLMTARPDLLPIDIKRQGRAEVHIALFYPQTEEEVRQLFVVMGKKNGSPIDPKEVPDISGVKLSGADIESLVTRSRRLCLLAGGDTIKREHIQKALDGFIPSAQDSEKRMQELAAIIACTEADMLPPDVLKEIREQGGKGQLLRRFESIKRTI